MNTGRFVLSQVLNLVHRQTLDRMVRRYDAKSRVRHFGCRQQLICMVLAQLTWRESLRDIEACLNAKTDTLYHLGFTKPIARSKLSEANESRDWRLWLDQLAFKAGAFNVMDRGYVDFVRLARIAGASAFFITRAKRNFRFTRHHSPPVNFLEGLRSDQIGKLSVPTSRKAFPWPLRKIRYFDEELRRDFVFLTNHLELSALRVAKLYKLRWQVELFSRWIKQNLRIKHFYGNGINAVTTQIWIAMAVYLMVAILHKQLKLPGSLHRTMQILTVHPFEKTPIHELLT